MKSLSLSEVGDAQNFKMLRYCMAFPFVLQAERPFAFLKMVRPIVSSCYFALIIQSLRYFGRIFAG